MQLRIATHQEEAEDIFFGQIVITLARWFFVSAIIQRPGPLGRPGFRRKCRGPGIT